MTKRKFTNKEFIEAVKSSISIREVLIKLNLRPAGGNYQSFRNLAKELELDTSHFLGQGHSKGKTIGPKRSVEEYLNNEAPAKSYRLKNRLLKEGYLQHICSNCNLTTWLGGPMPLELHHIDGNSRNNNLQNLTLLCPNCHTLTPNYRGKGKAISKS